MHHLGSCRDRVRRWRRALKPLTGQSSVQKRSAATWMRLCLPCLPACLCAFSTCSSLTFRLLLSCPPALLSLSLTAVEVVMEDDLRDACKPGDRVAIAGIYKPVAPAANGSVSGGWHAALVPLRLVSRTLLCPPAPRFACQRGHCACV